MNSESTVKSLLGSTSVTFAGIDMVTEVKPSAKFKTVKIEKATTANVTLYADLS